MSKQLTKKDDFFYARGKQQVYKSFESRTPTN
jgi:hypothetical protein